MAVTVRVNLVKPLLIGSSLPCCNLLQFLESSSINRGVIVRAAQMATATSTKPSKIIDSHLHLWIDTLTFLAKNSLDQDLSISYLRSLQGLNLHLSEIEELCTEFPKTVVMLDHVAFGKPPILAFSDLLKLSKFPQVHIKFSALFRVSRKPYPYDDLFEVLSKVVSSFGVNLVMWCSDFPFVVPECGYKEAKEAVSDIANQVLSSSELDWIMGGTIMQLFKDTGFLKQLNMSVYVDMLYEDHVLKVAAELLSRIYAICEFYLEIGMNFGIELVNYTNIGMAHDCFSKLLLKEVRNAGNWTGLMNLLGN
ncbi:uncharacterized protein LOC130779488 [Actinidia eriantha]|uniref:uncharacterized protein LOC130779488 n=1 Tax=Actinidia eriantha TaxID=165200 RepID=UPI00258FFCFE|nr:uncharacterized protein LOC130779488 [Actinidia eriantha]